jgi:hypothetical protein
VFVFVFFISSMLLFGREIAMFSCFGLLFFEFRMSKKGWEVVKNTSKTKVKKSKGKGKLEAKDKEGKLSSVPIQVAPRVVQVGWGSLTKDVLGMIFGLVFNPAVVLRCGLVNKHWRRVAKDLLCLTQTPEWRGFDLCFEACDALNHGEIIEPSGMLCAFVVRRSWPTSPVVLDKMRKMAGLKADVNEWLASRPASHDWYGEHSLIDERSRQVESIQEAFHFFNEKLRAKILVGDDAADTIPLCSTDSSSFNYVPRAMAKLLMASILCFDAAYSQQRDEEWPLERCLKWVNRRLLELDAEDDFECYFDGDYWMSASFLWFLFLLF